MPIEKMRTYYVSWVAVNNDPWPNWERTLAGGQITTGDGQPIPFRAEDDGEWPGVPERVSGEHRVVYSGPTLAALFHRQSDFLNLRNLHRVYLLYQKPMGKKSPHEYLRATIDRIVAARNAAGAGIDPNKTVFVPIDGIDDPTDHEQIAEALKKWIKDEDPFDFGKTKVKKRIEINLSPGTPSMHACWMMLHWSGEFRDIDVQFLQGDGGVFTGKIQDDAKRTPNRYIHFDVLTRFVKGPPSSGTYSDPAPGEDQMTMDQLQSADYADLREQIEKAALLGLPILLVGQRGSGKTFLAQHYHERRQAYRQSIEPDSKREKAEKSMAVVREPDAPHGEFITVTLSEYDQIQELRDTLFGWAKGAFTDASHKNDGLLGRAHKGTLFLDEIHHFGKPLQAALLGPMNNGRYRPKMATYELISDFDLVVATNEPDWESELAPDFRDRIKRIVLHVPSFNEIRTRNPVNNDLWKFWEVTLRRRCRECRVEYEAPSPECQAKLESALEHKPLNGNWRDLHRLADQVLLHLVLDRSGRPLLTWNSEGLAKAIMETFP